MNEATVKKATAALSRYLLDEPAGESGQFPYALRYSADEAIADNNEIESIGEQLGIEFEWAGSPDEDDDGNGYWPFRVA